MIYVPQTQPHMLSNSMIFSKFTEFGCHHHNSLSTYFHCAPKNPSLGLSHPQATLSLDLPVWDILSSMEPFLIGVFL